MKLLFDMRPVQKAQGRGIGYYCTGLIEGLASIEGVQLGYLLDHWRAPLPRGLPPGARYFSDRLEYLSDHYDVYIMTNLFSTLYFQDAYEYLVPSRVREKVGLVAAVVYDMLPWFEHPVEEGKPAIRKKFLEILSVMRSLDHVFCISEATREDVVRYTGTARSLTSVIYGSANPGTRARPAAYDFKTRANAVVYVGGSNPRKNVGASIEGFAAAYKSGRIPRDSQYFLVYKPDDISAVRALAEAAGVGDRVVATGFLPDAALDDLICNCKSTVFPSLYEGLGMPVIESYRLDTPCFVGDNSSLRELAPRECRFDVSKVEGIADMFTAALTDEGLCEASIGWGRSVASELTWEKIGSKTHGILAALVRAKAALSRSDRIFVRASALAETLRDAVRQAPECFGWVDGSGSELGDYAPRYSREFLARGTNRLRPVAMLFALSDDVSSAEAVRECAQEPRNVLYMGDTAFPRLLHALAGGDLGRLRAMLFSSYAERQTDIDSIKSFEDLEASGLSCVAPLVTLARPSAIVATDTAALEAARKDLSGNWQGPIILAPREGRALYEAIREVVGDVP